MEHQLGRTLRVFLIVLAAAGFYRLAIVPWVEPAYRPDGAGIELSPEQAAAMRSRADRRLAAVDGLFPPGSWEREEPIILESRQMRLLFQQYHSLPDGRVNLVPCTVILLPDAGGAAPGQGRTLVLRAPQGAVLEFDEPLDLRAGRLAKLVGGSLRGQVTIQGTPSRPDAEDDIEIVTRDIELVALEVRTAEMVQFRYGRSSGRGRGLVATLLPRPGGDTQGPNIGGVDTIRLERDVTMRLEGMASGMLPGGVAEAATDAPVPVHVQCAGSLCMNVSQSVVTLEDEVQVSRTLADGRVDELASSMLAIVMGKGDDRSESASGPTGRGLRPVEIQASGSPVVARGGSAGLEARAARLGYEVATRRILLDGEEPVDLAAPGLEMQARSIDYTPGPAGDPGSLMAVGPGWLEAANRDGPAVRVSWQKWLRMRPDGDEHVASISGETVVSLAGQGRLSSSELHLWLTRASRSAGPPDPMPMATPDLTGIRPARLLARGMVEVDAPQLAARTDRMELWFRETASLEVAADGAVGSAVPPAAVFPQPGDAGVRSVAGPSRVETPAQRFLASGDLVRGLISLSAAGNEVEEMSLEGKVRLIEETAATVAKDAGIEICGDQLQLTRANRFDARAVVSGRPATIQGRGLDLEGGLVEFDRGRNRMAVDGSGRLAVPVPAGNLGLEALTVAENAGPSPEPTVGPHLERLEITWQGRMDFDGQTARFIDQVETASGSTTLRAGSLDVVFSQAIDFSRGRGPEQHRTDVVRVACGSGVRIEHRAVDPRRPGSFEQLFVRDLLVDRPSGDFSGSGPGRLTSTRQGGQPIASMATPGGPPASAPADNSPQISFLGVDFQRGLQGNIHRRTIEFHQRVEAIWGPVIQWGDTLDLHAPGGLPEGAIAVTSDRLGIGPAPPVPGSSRPSLELSAGGNVLVEGDSFTARSTRLSYSEAKDLLVFEGDGRTDAQLYRQTQVGAAPATASAGKILYWRAANRVDVQDARFLDFQQVGGGGSLPGFPGLGTSR